MRTWKRIFRSQSWTTKPSSCIPLVRFWAGFGHICERVKSKLWQPHLQQLVQLLLQFLGVSVDFRFSGVEQEAVAEHLPQICQERPNAAVLVVVFIVQPLLDHVQGYWILDLLQILGKVEISAVPGEIDMLREVWQQDCLPEWHRLWPQLIHLQQKPSAKLQVPFWQVAATLSNFGWQLWKENAFSSWEKATVENYRENLINGGA